MNRAWPGQAIIAHWPLPDPAEFQGDVQKRYYCFWKVAQQLYRRIDMFCNLPMEKLDRLRSDWKREWFIIEFP